ncbi:aldo/keto reductase [Streptomyces hokutonensis]|uniref:aldo/keto reductase n=1 Tax=Streptomyces hokutonensis TaxID=1306990 RepID=UPI0037F6DAD6
MEYRRLGRSGLKVSEIAYGNWLTHGSQVEEDAARACVAAALDEGVTTFDTADVYALTRAEQVLGKALGGVRRESIEICTKVFWPTGPGPNDRGLSRKHIIESANASLRRLGTDYIDLYQAHRYDHETPLVETLRAFDDLVRQGKVLYIGVSEWRPEQIAAALRIADRMGLDRIVSNQPQYNMIWRVIEAEVVPLCEREGVGQLAWSPLAQGALNEHREQGAPDQQRGTLRNLAVANRHAVVRRSGQVGDHVGTVVCALCGRTVTSVPMSVPRRSDATSANTEPCVDAVERTLPKVQELLYERFDPPLVEHIDHGFVRTAQSCGPKPERPGHSSASRNTHWPSTPDLRIAMRRPHMPA